MIWLFHKSCASVDRLGARASSPLLKQVRRPGVRQGNCIEFTKQTSDPGPAHEGCQGHACGYVEDP